MPEVLDVLSPWPVVTTLVCYLGVGDLLNLSRSSSDCRAVLHGFPFPRLPNGLSTASSSQPSGDESNSSIRKDIFIGEHQTPQWKVLKGLAQLNCTEPNHKKGSVPKPCRYCSMPVCEACIVKESFAQKKPVFRTRTRCLCAPCWASGNPLSRRRFTSIRQSRIPSTVTHGDGGGEFCSCGAKDGWICSNCRDIQCDISDDSKLNCHGEGCSNPLGQDSDRRRICLWCDMPLFGGQTMVNRWGSYGRRRTVSGSESSRPPSPQDGDIVLQVANGDGTEASLEGADAGDRAARGSEG